MTAYADLTEEDPTATGLSAEDSTESGSIVTMASAKWGALLLDVATLTRQGGGRRANSDALLSRPAFGLFAVADGVSTFPGRLRHPGAAWHICSSGLRVQKTQPMNPWEPLSKALTVGSSQRAGRRGKLSKGDLTPRAPAWGPARLLVCC